MTEGTARYAREGGTWHLKLGGDVRHTLGPALNALLDRALADPEYTQFVIDLSAAENIDSTCLGILARIGNHALETGGPRSTIVSPGKDMREVLLAVCFDRMFNLVDIAGATASDLAALPAAAVAENTMLSLVLEAHRRLCAIDERTHTTFRDLVAGLEAEAQREAADRQR
jgi:anti-anti-sigma factor